MTTLTLSDIKDRRQIDIGEPVQYEEMDLQIVDDIFVKSTIVKEGTYLKQHRHEFDHITVVAHGSVRMWVDDIWTGDFKAPDLIHVAANKSHSFVALTDATIMCVHRIHEDRNGVSILKEVA
jgi:quercetin dioxygenase-like cupin family protein